jgi:hypothetical protein
VRAETAVKALSSENVRAAADLCPLHCGMQRSWWRLSAADDGAPVALLECTSGCDRQLHGCRCRWLDDFCVLDGSQDSSDLREDSSQVECTIAQSGDHHSSARRIIRLAFLQPAAQGASTSGLLH